MKRNLILLSVIIAGLYLTSCTPLYVPNVIPTPLMSKPYEFSGNLTLGTNGIDLQTAISPANHFAILTNGSWKTGNLNDSLYGTKSMYSGINRHNFGEIGAGYYQPFMEKGRFEIYGGGGVGNTESYFQGSGTNIFSTGSYYKLFMLSNVGLSTDIIDLSLSVRTSYVNYYEILAHNTPSAVGDDAILFEPAFTVKVGYKWVKYFFQFGGCIAAPDYSYFWHQPVWVSTGVHFTIGKWKDIAKNTPKY